MDFNNIEKLKESGFEGFETISMLTKNKLLVPKEKGVYLILSENKLSFVKQGTGGFFKDKDPNVSINELENNVIENTNVLYIGKAGKEGSKASLQSRLNQYFKFGIGKKVGHWGGRYIWQIKEAENLIVCWKKLPNEEPRNVESQLIQEFKKQYNARPFANLKD